MGPKILFIANAGAEVGGGHVMRSLTLAQALADLGATPVFAAAPPVAGLLDAFAPATSQVQATRLDAPSLRQAALSATFDAVVFDHYDLARPDHQAIAQGRPVLVIDDLADRPLHADLVLDSGPARTISDYAGLVNGAELLLGPAYALVRPAFARMRPAALARRGGAARRILVSLGLTDLGAITDRVVERIRRRTSDLALDVAVGSAAPSLAALRRRAEHDAALHLHVDSQEMAQLTNQADIGVGAAGSTTWERCVLGLPSLLLILAPNQLTIGPAMSQAGAALVVDAAAPDFAAAFDAALARLLDDAALRASLSAASASLCDGQGAMRAAKAFLARMRA